MRRRTIILHLLWTIILLLHPSLNFASTYYLSSTGSDSNSGTSSLEPWQTIAKLNSTTISPGDSILFQSASIFRGEIFLPNGGNPGAPIYFGTYGGTIPAVISGAELVSGWTVFTGSVYKASITSIPKHFFSNDDQQTIARYPNSGWLLQQGGLGNMGFIDTSLSQSNGYWNNAVVRLRTSERVFEINKVDSFYDHIVLFQQPSLLTVQGGYGYYFDDVFSELDTVGEWYHDSLSQSIYFFAPSDPNLSVTEASVYDNGLIIQSGNYLKIENLQFEKQRSSGIILLTSSSNIEIIDCRFRLQDLRGIDMLAGSSECVVSGNTFEQINGQGLGGNNMLNLSIIQNNFKKIGIIAGYGINGPNGGLGISLLGTDSINVTQNSFDSTGSAAILVSANHAVIAENILDHSVLLLNDVGAIYNYGTFGSMPVIRDNFILNAAGNIEATPALLRKAPGIYLDEFAMNSTVDHNTVAFCTHGVYVTKGSSSNTFINNLVFGCESSQVEFNKFVGQPITGNQVHHNILYSLRENSNPVTLESDSLNFMPATFDSNYYFNPYDYFGFQILLDSPATKYPFYFTLAQWQEFASMDAQSKSTFFFRQRYTVNDTIGTNLITNGEFTQNFDGWTANFPANITMLLDNSTPLDFGCLKLIKSSEFPEPEGSVYTSGIPIDSGAFYQARISSYSIVEGNFGIGVLAGSSDYTILTEKRYFPFSLERQEHSCVLQAQDDFDPSRFYLIINYTDSICWFDNVELFPVTVTYEEPTRKSRLFMNPTDQAMTFDLGDTVFLDLDQNVVTEELSLQPYSSAILIFDSSLISGTQPVEDNITSLLIFPNPVQAGKPIYIQLIGLYPADADLELYDLSGRVIESKKVNLQNQYQSLLIPGKVASGLYLVKVKSGQHLFTGKVVISD